MTDPRFVQLNDGWNAEPNAPEPVVVTNGKAVELTFVLNSQAYDATEDEKGRLTFDGCALWRLGSTNDEGWYSGQCRYSGIAPAWGEFYELLGQDDRQPEPSDWHILSPLKVGL